MKSYNDNFEVKERKSIVFYEVLYNNEDTIEFTSNYNKAIKKAKECAKCNDTMELFTLLMPFMEIM